VLDASAPYAPTNIAERIAAFSPDLVGLHLKTLHIQPAYALARQLPYTLVAGGPHATIVPTEPLAHGFTHVIRGEAEHTLVALANGDRAPITDSPFITDLDHLPPPLSALDLFDPAWYGATATLPPAGILSSRGCPAACTFCSNDVTGRRFRYRSPASVVAEIRSANLTGFSFFDDSFAVGRRRVFELCAALADLAPIYWTCTAHPAHLDRDILAAMRRAGCAGIDIGMESADPGMLVRIGKGVTVERVLDVLTWCAELGIHTVVNLMFGWPDETDAELAATTAFLERAAPLAGGFNARGVVVPYPGTAIYEANHQRFGFTRWWLDEAPLHYTPFPTSWDAAEIRRAYADDPALDRNFFHHPPHRLARIRDALARKAELTLAMTRPAIGVPAAGAR